MRDTLAQWSLEAVGAGTASPARRAADRGDDAGGRAAGLPALRQPQQADGLRRAGAGRTLLGSQAAPGQHHQGRQQRRAAHAGRGGVALPAQPRVSPIIAARHDQLPTEVTDIAWKAQLRLNAKFKRLRGTPGAEEQGRGRRGARAHRLRLGHRPRGADLGLAGHRDRARRRRRGLKTRTNTADQGEETGGAQTQQPTQMPEGERGAAAATGEPSTTLLVGRTCANACRAISVPRAKAAPRRKSVLRYPTLEYQHEQPSHILHGWQPQAPSRSPSGNGFLFTSAIAEDWARPLDREKPYQRWRKKRAISRDASGPGALPPTPSPPPLHT